MQLFVLTKTRLMSLLKNQFVLLWKYDSRFSFHCSVQNKGKRSSSSCHFRCDSLPGLLKEQPCRPEVTSKVIMPCHLMKFDFFSCTDELTGKMSRVSASRPLVGLTVFVKFMAGSFGNILTVSASYSDNAHRMLCVLTPCPGKVIIQVKPAYH